MKIIDEKGKLFGKINIIDFSVVLFLFCFIPVIYFVYKIASHKQKIEILSAVVEVELNCDFVKVSPDILGQVNVGDEEFDKSGNVIGRIVWLGESSPYASQFDIGSGNVSVVINDSSGFKKLPATLKVKAISLNNKLYHKSQQILLGVPFKFCTPKYVLDAVPVSSHADTKDLSLTVILKELDEKVLNLISAGDKELDDRGNVLAEILSIDKIVNNSYNINFGPGNIIIANDNSGKKQAYVKMRIRCEIKDNKLYFNGKSVASNLPFIFITDKYTALATLEKISYEYKWLKIQVRFNEILPEISRIINEGDVERSSEREIIGKIEKILSNGPSIILTSSSGKFAEIAHPSLRDVELILDVLCVEKNSNFYFSNYLIRIGNSVTFTTDLYTINGTIINVLAQ